MADVARLAGVSAMTVSRALRQEASVSEATRARVLEVIDEIGYVPDQAAGALSSGRSGLVAAILPTLSMPMFGQMARGLSQTLSNAGLQLFLSSSDYSPTREEDILRAVLRRRPEAIVLAGVGHTERTSRLLAGAGVPVVEFLDGASPPVDHLVELDPQALARATTKFLLAKNRRRLAVVWSKGVEDRRGEARARALVAAARELSLPEPIVLRHGDPMHNYDVGSRAVAEIADRGLPVDAVVFLSDDAAIGALTAFRRLKIKVPDQIAVIGFGDCEYAMHVQPTLTTIRFNAVGAGVEVGKIMLSSLDTTRLGKASQPFRLTLDFEIVERESA